MSTETSSRRQEQTQNRSVGGVLIHGFACLTTVFGAGLVYVLSSTEFTKQNARNALNWHILLLTLFAGGFLSFSLGADEFTVLGVDIALNLLPGPLGLLAFGIGVLLLLIWVLGLVLMLVFATVATIQALRGKAWRYPLSPRVL